MTFGENFLTFFYAFDLNQRKSNNIPYRNSLPLFKNAPLVSITQGERLFSISSLVLIIEFCLSSLPAASRG